MAGGGLAGAAPLSAGGVLLLPDGLVIDPDEESEGAAAGGAAGALLCEDAGGAAAGSVLEEDGFFAQAVSSSAAASALRATLVFIDRYPDTLVREPIRESFLNDFFYRSASPSRVACPNFIESPPDLKQPEPRLSPWNDKAAQRDLEMGHPA